MIDGGSRTRSPEAGEVHVWRFELPAGDRRGSARTALRALLGRYLDEEPGAIVFAVGEHGKPELAVAPERLSFNLSHSEAVALVAVADGTTPVGVDVELIKPRRDLVRLADRWLPADDGAAVAAAPETELETVFYAAWTRHEARVKCTGTGLAGPAPRAAVLARQLPIDAGYAAAMAFDADATGTMEPRITIQAWEP